MQLWPMSAIWGFQIWLEKIKKQTFKAIKEKLGKKLHTWKGKMFSQEGKEVLIKAIALAISSYTMSVFRIPSMLCDDLQKLIARFW